MKRLIRGSYSRNDLWEEVKYIYDLIVNQGKEEYVDEYACSYINYELADGLKGYKPSGKKYRDLYLRLSGPDSITSSKKVKATGGRFAGVSATILSPAQYEAQKDYLDYQFKENDYRFYSKPGKQYSWTWYAVPYAGRLE